MSIMDKLKKNSKVKETKNKNKSTNSTNIDIENKKFSKDFIMSILNSIVFSEELRFYLQNHMTTEYSDFNVIFH